MRLLLRIINRFFVTLGIIFFVLIAGLVYIFVADPFDLKPIFKTLQFPSVNTQSTDAAVDKNPLLSDQQEKTLETFGINPAALPAAITPEMEKCFREKLGNDRVDEIMKTGQPDVTDFFSARSCIEN